MTFVAGGWHYCQPLFYGKRWLFYYFSFFFHLNSKKFRTFARKSVRDCSRVALQQISTRYAMQKMYETIG